MSNSYSRTDTSSSAQVLRIARQLHARTVAWPIPARIAWWVLLLPVALALFSAARLQGWPRRVGFGVAALTALMFVSAAFSSSPATKPAVSQLVSAGQASEDAATQRRADADRAAATAAAEQAARDRAAAEAAAAKAAADKAAAEQAARDAAAARAAAEKAAAQKAAAQRLAAEKAASAKAAAARAAADAAARQQAAAAPQTFAATGGSGGTDPRFGTCREAKANGYGPYRSGVDTEYDWYRDADSDGIVCE